MKKYSVICRMSCVLIILILLLCPPIAVYGLEVTSPCDVYALEEQNEYAYAIANEYLSIYAPESEDAHYFISQGFPIQNAVDENVRIYFIFEQRQCVGELTTTFVDGNFYSSYTHIDNPLITEALSSNQALILIRDGENLLYSCENQLYSHIDLTDDSTTHNLSINYEEISFDNSGAELLKVEVLLNTPEKTGNMIPYSTVANERKVLPVSIVRNSTVNERGLCWAATVSSMIAYRNGTAPLTARQIYDVMDGKYPSDGAPDSDYVGLALQHYSVDYQYLLNGRNFTQVRSSIIQNRPLYAGIYPSFTTYSGHAVLICGYEISVAGTYFYHLMDPNKTSIVTVQIDPSSSDFTYVASSSNTYVDWRQVYY